MAAECRVFGDNSAAEFHGVSLIAAWNLAKFTYRPAYKKYLRFRTFTNWVGSGRVTGSKV